MKGLIFKILLTLIGLGMIAGLVAAIAFAYFNLDLPKIEKLQDYKPNLASQIYSKDGVLLAELGLEKREIVEIKDVPQRVIDAFLSAEDDKFFEHKGVDYLGLARAMFANFRARKVVQGGSTITQQVAKSLLLSSERSLTRKVKDFILAQRIEEKLNKNEILYLYLNQVYLGGGFYGIKAAARGYYNKELKNVTVAEAAMLAGLLVAPGKYSPYVNPHAAKKRQHYVIERLYKLNKITKQEYEQALKESTIYHIREDELKAPYFTEWVRQKVVDTVGENSFLIDGYKIKTSLDWDLQKVAEEQVQKGIKEIDKRQGYKGPFAHLGNDEIEKFEIESRRNIYRKKSSFFTIDDNNEKMFEFNFNEKMYRDLKEQMQKAQANLGEEIVVGLSDVDNLPEALDSNTQYEAVVSKVDDATRLIYVSLAGSPGIIPFEYFKWAHKRSITENTAYFQEVTKPSTILKSGDLIYVQVIKKIAPLGAYLGKEALSIVNKSKSSNLMKVQRYIICQLDQIPEVQGALFSIDARSGEIISYVGGTDYKLSKFNRVVQAKRQPGSSFKPILFSAALEHGYNPTTIIMDTPEAMPGFDAASSWKPKNYDGEYRGPVTFRVSLEQSRNIPTIKIADKVGVGNILKFAERVGFQAKMENNLSIALGTFGVSPRDLVTTYAIFPNGGKQVTSKAILSVIDRDGKKYAVDESDNDQKATSEKEDSKKIQAANESNSFLKTLGDKQVYDPRLAFIMTHIMKGVITSGTAASAHDLSPNIAGKTGTTNDYVDAWFVGFTSNIVTGVWTGFDDNKTLGYGETGGKSALPIWKEYMRANIKKYGDQPFELPAGITSAWTNKESGKRVAPNSPGSILEYFAEDIPEANVASPNPSAPGTTAPSVAPVKQDHSKGDDEYYDQ